MFRKLHAWLIRTHLTDNPSDFGAIVNSNGHVGIVDIVDMLVEVGMEIKRETAIDIINRFNRKAVDLILTGYNVKTGLVNLHATIRGLFHGKTWDSERNRVHIAILAGLILRNAMKEVEVEILGEHPASIALFNITDLSTKKTDGSVTRGFNAELHGTCIKILGDDPAVGVWLRNTVTEEDLRLPDVNIALNEPSRLLLLIPPTFPLAEYELRVVTQSSTGSKLLKTPRSATLAVPVVVE